MNTDKKEHPASGILRLDWKRGCSLDSAAAGTGVAIGGLLRDIGEVVAPGSLRRTTLYRTMVEVTLGFLIEGVNLSENLA